MKIFYRDTKLRPAGLELLDKINNIIEEYAAIGIPKMTLRQLYYQLVSRGIIANKPSEYSKISDILVEGRMAGIVDWEAIEDRLRVPYRPYHAASVSAAMRDIARQYKTDRQAGQPYNLLVIVEKDALSGVLRPVTSKYMIPLLVNRGYGSCTIMHDMYTSFSGDGRPGKILYIGDHDPSGKDMIRDVVCRIGEFGYDVKIDPIALTWDQIEEYDPVPNPAKITDPRAKGYIEKYGNISWEVDALRPNVLSKILEDSIIDHMDMDVYREVMEDESEDRKKLYELADHLET